MKEYLVILGSKNNCRLFGPVSGQEQPATPMARTESGRWQLTKTTSWVIGEDPTGKKPWTIREPKP